MTATRAAVGVLSPAHAADWLDLGLTTVYALMKTGDLPYVRIGRVRRIAVTDLEGYIARLDATVMPAKSSLASVGSRS